MEHNCCDEAKYLRYDKEGDFWYIIAKKDFGITRIVEIKICPWCGEKLPMASLPSIKTGDYVIYTGREIRILPQEANGQDGIRYAKVTDLLIGTIAEVDTCFGNHWIDVSPKRGWPYKKITMKTLANLNIVNLKNSGYSIA